MSNEAACKTERVNQFALPSALDNQIVKSFFGGTLSGLTSCVLLQPLDLLKTRIQASRSPSSSTSSSSTASPQQRGGAPGIPRQRGRVLLATTIEVVKNERIFGLWQGLRPSLVRTVPGVGLYFATLHSIQTYFGWEKLTAAQSLFSGILSRCIAGTILLPVTVVKTRFESKDYKYRSVTGALTNIYRSEGYKGLYSGLTATLLRDAPFSGLYLAFYSQAKSLTSAASIQMTMPVHFTCGVCAGILASAVTQPFDVVKTHMQLYPSQYTSFSATLQSIVKNAGVSGLLTGMVPRCIRRTLMAALTWMVYEEMKIKLNLK